MNPSFNVGVASALTAAYIIIFPLALSANILLIYIVLKRPTMKTTTNYLFANLAAVNLVVVAFVIPHAVRQLYVGDTWFQGAAAEISCRLVHFAHGISLAGSIISLIATSLDQFYAILYPVKRIAALRNIKFITIVIWISSVVLMSPYLAMFGVRERANQHKCIYLVRNRIIMEIHISFTFVFLYAFPLVLIGTMYALIGRKLWFRTLPGNIHSIQRQAAERSKRRLIRMLVIVIVTYASCWLPFHALQMLTVFNKHLTRNTASYWWLIISFITHVNSAVNPCLVIALNKKFRFECCKLWVTWRLHCSSRTAQAVSGSQRNSRTAATYGLYSRSVENLLERIARTKGRLYDLKAETKGSKSSPISLVQFTYFNKALETDI